jgi:hypothetical protein
MWTFTARAMGISLFAGEAEGRLEMVLQDAYAKKPQASLISWRTFPASMECRSRSSAPSRAQRTAGT